MSETVCVTVEQLTEWLSAVMTTSIRHLSDPKEVQFFADQFHSLELTIAQGKRLKVWKPKVGDRVRLKTMPDAGVWTVGYIGVGIFGIRAYLVRPELEQLVDCHRYVAELMPEEEEL